MTGLLEFVIGAAVYGAFFAWIRSGHGVPLPVLPAGILTLQWVGSWTIYGWLLVAGGTYLADHRWRLSMRTLAAACVAVAVGITGAAIYGITTS